MLARLKHLSALSITYGLGSLLIRISGLILIPIYTRHLTTNDYGILSVSTATIALIGGVFGLGLADAAVRLYFDASDENESRSIIGTIWFTWLILATFLGFLLLTVSPIFGDSSNFQVPYYPYLVLAITIAYLQAMQTIPLALIRTQERARLFVTISTGIFLTTAFLSIILVVIKKQGATGALSARAVAQLIGAIILSAYLLKNAKVTLRLEVAKSALRFGLPLVPTVFFGWLIRLSDRVLMQRFVGLGEIGVYTLGYQIGESILMIGFAVNSAWSPYYFQTFQIHGNKAPEILSPIITYWMLMLVACALVLSVFAKEAIQIISTYAYLGAASIIPWIAAASVVQVFNVIQRFSLMNAKVTKWDPLIFLFGGVTNVSLNLLLIPRFGVTAAAWNTLIAFIVMGIAMFVLSQRISRFDYEYRRLALMIISAIVIYLVSLVVPASPTVYTIVMKLGLLALFPIMLFGLGFLTERERTSLKYFCIKYLDAAKEFRP